MFPWDVRTHVRGKSLSLVNLLMISFLLLAVTVTAQPKVFLTYNLFDHFRCPPSIDMSSGRSGNTKAPCENFDLKDAYTQHVKAGDRLKVGWLSGNRGGM